MKTVPEQVRDRSRFGALIGLCALISVSCRGSTPAPVPPVQVGRAPVLRAHFIDVGQGDATLVELPCGLMLIDTGGEKNDELDGVEQLTHVIDAVLESRPDLEPRLDLLVLTHPHIDHTRGVDLVLERYAPKNIITNGRNQGSGRRQQQRAIEYARSNNAGLWEAELDAIGRSGETNDVIDPITCDPVDPEIRVLWGAMPSSTNLSETDQKNGNNHSVAIRVSFGEASLLFTGDLEDHAIDALVRRYEGTALLDVDVYQVGHHGSANGTTEGLLRAMTPEMAVISMGAPTRTLPWTAWAYGHPRAALVEALERSVTRDGLVRSVPVAIGPKQFEPAQVHKAIQGTGWDGTVVLEADSEGRWQMLAPNPVRVASM